MKKNNKILALAETRKGMYYLCSHSQQMYDYVEENKDKEIFFKYESDSDILEKWHKRLGHMSSNTIRDMILHKTVLGMPDEVPKIKSNDCVHCTMGKQSRTPIKGSLQRRDQSIMSLEVGDEIHSDQAGPMTPTSHYGSKYIVEFIDGASRLGFLYGVKSLTETIEKYKIMKMIFSTHLSKKIKTFICDGHGTYDCMEFEKVLQQDGTMIKIRAPYEPRQNAVAERRIRTLFEMARTLLLDAGIPQIYWEDAIMHANFIRNRVPTKILKGMTPFEKFWGRKPDVKWLRPFGSLCYVLIPDGLRKRKFDAKAEPAVVLGMSSKHSAYKILMLGSRKIKISKDVRFYENIFPFRSSIKEIPFSTIDYDRKSERSNFPELTAETFNVGNQLEKKGSEVVVTPVELQADSDRTTNASNTTAQNTSSSILEGLGMTNIPSSEVPRMGEICTSFDFDKEMNDLVNNEKNPNIGGDVGIHSQEENVEKEDNDDGSHTPPVDFTFPRVSARSNKGVNNKIGHDYLMSLRTNNSTFEEDPKTLKKALKCPDKEEWIKGAKREFGTLNKLKTFAPITPELLREVETGEYKVHKTKSLATKKRDGDGKLIRHKVRTVVQGCTMTKGVEYDETFSPTARLSSVRLVTALAAQKCWNIEHLDVPNAYVQGDIDRTIITTVPEGWNEIIGSELGPDGSPCVLKKALYGTPHAGRLWNKVIHNFITNVLKFKRTVGEPSVYYKHGKGGSRIVLVLYVDDIIITGDDCDEKSKIIQTLIDQWDIQSQGPLKFALGISFEQNEGIIRMHQKAFIDKIMTVYKMKNCKGSNVPMQPGWRPSMEDSAKSDDAKKEMAKIPYREAVGSLLYLALGTRPDIMYPVAALARYCQCPGRAHWTALKKIIQYLKQTRNNSLNYSKGQPLVLDAYSDSSYNDDPDKGKSTCSYIVRLAGSVIAWKSKLSKGVPQSVMEAEIIATNLCARELMWSQYLLKEVLGEKEINNGIIYCDNNPAISHTKDHKVSDRSKHIRPKYFYVRELVDKKEISVVYVKSSENLADIGTKALNLSQLSYLSTGMGLTVKHQ